MTRNNEKPIAEDPQEPATETQDIAAEAATAAQIADLEEKLAQMKDQWVRAAAETENIRKRAERDQQETARYAAASFARDMVGVLENVKRAAESITPEKRAGDELLKTVGDGLDMTVAELTGIFERHGIKRINPMGEKFDHNLHQAVVQVEQPGTEPNTVIQVVQAGYIMHDRLLKPAMVAVTKAASDEKKLDTSA
ncbi:MAG: nucleotide exchange factor GrpE [Alphaproteobacteria bacterium]|nr:nucleotide exchange factor GrpE [Alphaproteobacteria bacterium]